MVERLVHVLIHVFVSRVEDGALLLVQVHQEAIDGQALLLLRWWTEDKQHLLANHVSLNTVCGVVYKTGRLMDLFPTLPFPSTSYFSIRCSA